MAEGIVAALREKFEIENVVGFDLGQGGMPRIVITSRPCEAHIYLYGAHVTHYRRRGHAPQLFLSACSNFVAGKPIRGGVPICWPWFGPRKNDPVPGGSPMHGFARLMQWDLLSVTQAAADVKVVLGLKDNEYTRELWPHAFELRYTVIAGATLELALEVKNTGDKPFTFEEALHTYFAVSDVRNVDLLGLGGSKYTTKVGAGGVVTQPPDPLKFTGETDSVYAGNTATCTIVDPGEERRTTVAKENSRGTVVWNPHVAKAKAMPDFGDDEWPRMLCVESCNVWDDAVTLQPGQTHTMKQKVESHRME